MFDGKEGRPEHGAPIAAFQFAVTYQSEENYHIRALSIANDRYNGLLNEFISNEGSILFSKQKTDIKDNDKEKYESLTGNEHQIFNTSLIANNFTPPKETIEAKCDFQIWNKYLSEKEFGRSSVWLSLVDKSQDEWRFSIDFFLILNIDITDKLLKDSEFFKNINKDDFYKWKFKYDLFEILYSFANDYGVGIITKSLNEALNKQSIRSAISQVMARNMSHNIGSHVLSRMVNVDSIRKFINATHSSTSKSPTENQYKGFLLNNDYAKDSINLIATFNSYLKSRMDFLADITTGVPTVENSKWFYKEVLSGLDKNRLLLDRISGISNFNYKIIAKIIRTSEGSIIGEKTENDYALEVNATKYEITDDLMVSIPNDVLGCHAFYIIIENIIRNCVKHGGEDSKNKTGSLENPLHICIDIKECTEPEGNELYEVTVYDNSVISENCLDKLVLDQNTRLNQSILKDGSLRQGSWGLIEMDASAAYLRKIPVEQVDQECFDIDLRQTDYSKKSYYPEDECIPKQLNTLKAVAVEGDHLGYRLFLFKPREILIIDDSDYSENIDEQKRNELLKSGILLCNTSGKKSNFVYDPEKIYNHKLVVIISDKHNNEIIKSNETGLSERILKIKKDDVPNHIALQVFPYDIERFQNEIWKSYIKVKDEYSFYSEYKTILIDNDVLDEILDDKETDGFANYYGHGERYEDDEDNFNEITYSAVEDFLPRSEKDVVKGMQFIDSIHNRIVILDERIQEYAKNGNYKPKDGDDIPINVIYKNTKVFVPNEKVCNLGKQNFDENLDNILSVFNSERTANFFIIHLGIIEKLIESFNRKNNTNLYNKDTGIQFFLETIICKPYHIDYNKLVVISGRGKPHNLPGNTRYLNYSIISQYMIDLRFKFLLSEAIYSARRVK